MRLLMHLALAVRNEDASRRFYEIRAATPRTGGERQPLQTLVAAREGAVNAKRASLCQLRDLLSSRSDVEPLQATAWRCVTLSRCQRSAI